ncbi:MAG: penicillin-binding protein 2 [Patescibacteria group bacterium]|jgi:cell division protein FtsI/penicillin-binding protein 2
MRRFGTPSRRENRPAPQARLRFLGFFLCLPLLAVMLRLGYLQILEHGTYAALASDQHDLEAKLLPERGKIYVRDEVDNKLYPLATNRDSWLIYAVPRNMKDPVAVAHDLAPLVGKPDVDLVTMLTRDPNDPYEVVLKNATTVVMQAVKEKSFEGLGFLKVSARLYPEKGVSGQLIGFVGPGDAPNSQIGKYGIEGAFNELLAGKPGSIVAEKDASGRRLTIGESHIQAAVNGSDVVLTIDRTIQFEACSQIKEAVERHQADDGSIVVMDPNTGAIMAMCSFPDFDPTEYGKVKDIGDLNNPVVFTAYEPGSIFKSFTMAAGIHAEKIGPKTTYIDTGSEEIDDFTIRNSDGKAHGLQTMTQAIDESLNTATIFVQRLLGKDSFRNYVDAFGFGKRTEIELSPEGKGNVSSLVKKGSIWAATASYGQGVTATPIQLVAGYAALANGGKLMRPYIVDEIIHPDGTRERTKPQVVSTPVDPRTSRLISGMLVSAVENGHGKRAGVPGYWVAGKTGTAQVARGDGLGYQKDVTIGSFVGFAPASDPRFIMLIKINHPKDVQWAESSAAPLFGTMAKFLLTYLKVPPERNIAEPPPVVVPVSTSTNTGAES